MSNLVQNYLRSLVCLFLCLLPVLLCAQPLWQDAQTGMSYALVQKHYPLATAMTHVDTLEDGSKGLLQLNNININGRVFYAIFYFKQKKLAQIILTLDEARPFDQTLTVFDLLTEALRKKYGKETSHEEKNNLMQETNSTWVSNGTQINLKLIGAGNNNALLTLSYK